MTNELTNEWAAEEDEQLVNDRLDVVRKVQEDMDDLGEDVDELVELDVAEDSLSSIDDLRQEELNVDFHLGIKSVQSLDDSDVGRWSWQVEEILFGQWQDGGDQVVDGVEGRLDQAWEELLEEWDQQLGEVKTSFTEETQDGSSDQVDGVVNDSLDEWVDDVVDDETPGISLTEETQDGTSNQIDGVIDDGLNKWIDDVIDDESPSVSFTEKTQNSTSDQVNSVVNDGLDEWVNDVVNNETPGVFLWGQLDSVDGDNADKGDQ